MPLWPVHHCQPVYLPVFSLSASLMTFPYLACKATPSVHLTIFAIHISMYLQGRTGELYNQSEIGQNTMETDTPEKNFIFRNKVCVKVRIINGAFDILSIQDSVPE